MKLDIRKHGKEMVLNEFLANCREEYEKMPSDYYGGKDYTWQSFVDEVNELVESDGKSVNTPFGVVSWNPTKVMSPDEISLMIRITPKTLCTRWSPPKND